MMSKLRTFLVTTFIGGVLVILPIAVFAFLINWIINLIGNLLDPLVALFPKAWDEIMVKLIAFAIVIAFCFLVGLFVRTQFGSSLFDWVEEQWLSKLPFYSTIKETVQQFLGNKKKPFSRVVLVDIFGNNTRMTGFITDEHANGDYTIFVPTGPNPTNGFIFHVSPDQVDEINVPVEDAMRSIIGVGTGSSKIYSFKKLYNNKDK